MTSMHQFADITVLNVFVGLLLNKCHYFLVYLLQEYITLESISSVSENLFVEIYSLLNELYS
jgi:hypothetical protein